METADVVLMSGDLTRLPFAVRVARLARPAGAPERGLQPGDQAGLYPAGAERAGHAVDGGAADMGVSLLVTFNGLRPLRMKE